MPPPPKTPAGTTSTILLIEEYEALAIAFGSALKSFARDYQTHVSRSLKEAEKSLQQHKPALLIVDCDPPPFGALGFFSRVRTTLPDARILIIAAENSEEFTRENGRRAALQFMKKPFELEKFGKTVRGLLRANRGAGIGRASDLKLLDLILLHAMTEATTVLKVGASGARAGEIHFAEGRIVHAAAAEHAGVAAIAAMLHWTGSKFADAERPMDGPRSIKGDWTGILREALTSEPPLVQNRESEPPPPSVPEPARKKIVVIDDTELLLVFVEEALTTAHPEFDVVTATSGNEGIRIAAAEHPDLVLLDYSLPDITGGDVCAHLLKNEATAQIPLILMSGHVPEMMDAAESYENVVANIAKPFLSSALIELVERTLSAPPAPRRPPKRKVEVPPEPQEISEAPAKIPEAAEEPEPPGTASKQGESEPVIYGNNVTSIFQPSPVEHLPSAILVTTDTNRSPSELFATIPTARANAIVVGFSLEVISMTLSPALRVAEIRARPSTFDVAIHVLAQGLSGEPTAPTLVSRCDSAEMDPSGRLAVLRIAPVATASGSPRRHLAAIDGVAIEAAEDQGRLRLVPTSTAPMRFELLGLFELARVELSTAFSIEHLVLNAREEKMRATFYPEAAHLGATFLAQQIHLDSAGRLVELLLVAV